MRRTKEDAEKTKIAILEAAETLFLQKGVSRTSLEEIARKAGLTRGAVYWHFKNKAHLITELLGQVCLPLDQMVDQLVSLKLDSVNKLYQLCSYLVGEMNFTEKSNIFVILLRRCEFTEDLVELEQSTNKMINDMIGQFILLLNEPDSLSRLRPDITSESAAHMIHVMLVGMLSDWARRRWDANIKYQPQKMIDVLFQGLFVDWHPNES